MRERLVIRIGWSLNHKCDMVHYACLTGEVGIVAFSHACPQGDEESKGGRANVGSQPASAILSGPAQAEPEELFAPVPVGQENPGGEGRTDPRALRSTKATYPLRLMCLSHVFRVVLRSP